MQLKLRWRVLFWLQEAMAELQAEQKRKALEEEQKLAQERVPMKLASKFRSKQIKSEVINEPML
jgi:hypothetical protein